MYIQWCPNIALETPLSPFLRLFVTDQKRSLVAPPSLSGEAGSVKKRVAILGALVGILLLIVLSVMVTTRLFFAGMISFRSILRFPTSLKLVDPTNGGPSTLHCC